MKTILIALGIATYLFILMCLRLYHSSDEYKGNRDLALILDVLWPVTYLPAWVGVLLLGLLVILARENHKRESELQQYPRLWSL
ncbi:MAG TPA: hypothetical protein PK046_01505 [Candidatus Syntrophosphaera sp.]|jgi:hypothetical protein|nr:hypothetical protein [Candidatus Syntrophosphaera sp.]HPW37977.1 hypothetical protein [Candidatus Syntrophosphaera sp.]HQC47139.1 hypothetical protein [Candidatus Syntrophosphaera sp.]